MSAFPRGTLVLAIFLAAGAAVNVALGTVATFVTTADLTMGSVAPYSQNNEGVEYYHPIGSQTLLSTPPISMDMRTVLRFNVASLGGIPNLHVNSISLNFITWGYSFDPAVPLQPEVHAITAANRDWLEGTGVGYWFVPNETCWVAKQTGATPGSVVKPWAGSPGLNTPGVDYDSTALATRTIDSNQLSISRRISFNFSGSSAQLTSLINSWIDDNYTLSRDNPGLLVFDPSALGGGNQWIGFYSLQCTNPPWPDLPPFPASWRPQLIVDYSIPEPGTLILLASGLIGLLCYAWKKHPNRVTPATHTHLCYLIAQLFH